MNPYDSDKVESSPEAELEKNRVSRRRFLTAVVTGTAVVTAADGLAAATDVRPKIFAPAGTSAQLEAVLSRYGSEFGRVRRIR